MYSAVLAFFVALAVAAATDYPAAPPIFDAKPSTTWGRRSGKSRLGEINVAFTAEDGSSDFVKMFRLDLVGDAYTRGYDQGFLMHKEILGFAEVGLNKYFMDMILNLSFDTSNLPKALQDIFHVIKVKGATMAPKVFNEAMWWVYQKEEQYIPGYLIDEMNGLGVGICAGMRLAGEKCDVTEVTNMVKRMNMLPELIRMACTAYGAWGKANSATNNGTLVQLRALDFGGGPFANFTVIATNREEGKRPFVSVTFPSFVGVITGIAQDGVGISEKVWMTYDKYSLKPGSYDGEADAFVLRDILQNSKNRKDAETYLQSVPRTWGMWVGIGDFETQTFDLVGYQQESAVVYTDETMPSMTGQPYLEQVAYVDKHPQPSGEGPTGTLPTFLTDFYGDITMENTRIAARYHKTGDLHIASYDYGNNKMIVSIGRINEDGEYGPVGGDTSLWKAYNRPYLQFDLDELWKGE